tara:strand:+ start:75 stop:407 length:333 start_codon:yes stop_codon:yes gene_type:complete
MLKKFTKNFINSLNGLKFAINEHSFIAELVGGIFLIPYLFFSEINFLFKLLILIVYFLLLAFEIINTSIEKLCDKITSENDNEIKIIKDQASAAVFIILCILIILIIFTF